MLVDQTVQVGKELQDVFALFALLAKDVKSGKSLVEVGTDCLPALFTAIQGVGDISSEIAVRKAALVTVALGASDILDALA